MDTLFETRTFCENGCGRELTGVHWEVFRPESSIIDQMVDVLPVSAPYEWRRLVVCAGCAHDFERKRQCR